MSRIAVLDLGSNSFHLLVADLPPAGDLTRVQNRKIMLRLAEPVTRSGELGPELRHRGVAAIEELVGEAIDAGSHRVAAVATDALRRAVDGEAFCDEVEQTLGLRVHVLTGLEEAALSWRAMHHVLTLPPSDDLLGLDLGGGSLEVGFGTAGRFMAGTSLALGSAQVAARFERDPPRLAERAAVHEAVSAQLEPLAKEILALQTPGRGIVAAGTAGTIRDLARCSLAMDGAEVPAKIRGTVIRRDQLEAAYARIVAVPTRERARLPGVGGRRIDLLPAGGIILLATLEAFTVEQLVLCDWGLREGVLLDLLDGGGLISETHFVAGSSLMLRRSRRGIPGGAVP